MKNLTVTMATLAICLFWTSVADARSAVILKAGTVRSIKGDVLWMRIYRQDREILSPFTLDYKRRQCWAPASVFEESCTVTVERRRHGRRRLENGSSVDVKVTYTRNF